jgi:hypothetical protein
MTDREQYTPGPASGAQIHKEGEKWTLILVRELRHPPAMVWQALTDPATLQALWAKLTPVQQQVVAEVVHHLGGQYNTDLIEAKYPGSPLPKSARGYSASFYVIGGKKDPATPFDLFFFYNYDLGRYIPSDLAKRLRELAPAPPPAQLKSHAKPPAIRMQKKFAGVLPELMVSEAERERAAAPAP